MTEQSRQAPGRSRIRERNERSHSVTEASAETGTLSTRGYNLIRKLGEGAYAKVYLATYSPSGPSSASAAASDRKTLLACKVVDTARAPRDFVRRFLPRELDILKKLNHPHIVHVHSIFQRRNKYFIFMRLAEKGDLLEWVLKHGAITESQSRVWMRQLSLALQYLQILEIAHRDLKCENVLITANCNVKLADFGFARYCVDNRGRRVLSSTNCGSLSYAAPEILRGDPYDPRISDVWSLGVVLYIMLNKTMPFDDTNINRLHDEQIHRRWRFCDNVIDSLSEQVRSLMYTMLEPDTQRRCQVDSILASDWMGMDSRLTTPTAAEQAALAAAKQDRDRRNRRTGDNTDGGAPVIPPLPADPPSTTGRADEETESVQFPVDSRDTPLTIGNSSAAELPRTPEEIDLVAASKAAELNPHAQPSHGNISIMDSEPTFVSQPEFLPPDLSDKLTSKPPSTSESQITKQDSDGTEKIKENDQIACRVDELVHRKEQEEDRKKDHDQEEAHTDLEQENNGQDCNQDNNCQDSDQETNGQHRNQENEGNCNKSNNEDVVQNEIDNNHDHEDSENDSNQAELNNDRVYIIYHESNLDPVSEDQDESTK